jgi:hypothetical protein
MAITTSAITTSWTPPDPLTGVSVSVIEELSHIQLDWEISTLADVDFSHYSVERRLLGEVSWTVLASLTSKTTLQYKDASAGQGIAYEYQVINYKAIPGDAPLASDDNIVVSAMLESDVWFVIGNENPEDEVNSFELPVSDENHTRPIQQEVFEPIAHARKKVARGNVLGYEGSLTLRWTTQERTEAKTQLAFLAESAGPHFLKSPFGDVWRVEFDAPDYKYSGGGNLLVEIGWVEVA